MTMHDDDCGCDEYNELSRRQFIADSAGMSGLAMFASVFPSWLPKVVLAESYVADRDVIISIFLRGGADGLSMCVPFGDPNYYTGRPTIAIPRPDSTATATRGIALDAFFALPRALQALSDHGLIESRRGLGMFVTSGARERLLRHEREQFLQKDWPALRAKLQRLGLTAKDLNWEST